MPPLYSVYWAKGGAYKSSPFKELAQEPIPFTMYWAISPSPCCGVSVLGCAKHFVPHNDHFLCPKKEARVKKIVNTYGAFV